MKQLTLHKKIDEFFKQDNTRASFKVDKEYINNILFTNPDSKNYFWKSANEKWIDTLSNAGIIADEIKGLPISYEGVYGRMPALDYLVNMANVVPEKVSSILASFGPKIHKYNPIYINQVFWMLRSFAPHDIKKVLIKIRTFTLAFIRVI